MAKQNLKNLTKQFIGKPLPQVDNVASADASAVHQDPRKKKQIGNYKKVDSTKSDFIKKYGLPIVGGVLGGPLGAAVGGVASAILPPNIKQLGSKLLEDARMSDKSLTDDQKLLLWDVIQAAKKRTGKADGGTEYSDYGTLGLGSSEQYNDWFNHGNIGLVEGAYNSLTNPGFQLGSTVGRGKYFTDPENPDKVYYTDVYDWNPGEKYFSGNKIYQKVRNTLRAGEDQHLNAQKNDNYRMNFTFDAKEMQKLKNERELPLDATLDRNGGWLDKYEDGGELNYNDYSVSAPKGFQGDGYSNVGRNYSPAWGGQFEDGGEMPTDKKSQEFYNTLKEYYTSPDRTEAEKTHYAAFQKLNEAHGYAPVRVADRTIMGKRSMMNPFTGRLNLVVDPDPEVGEIKSNPEKLIDKYITEYGHYQQYNENPEDSKLKKTGKFLGHMVKDFGNMFKNTKGLNFREAYNNNYLTPGTTEYEAHQVIQPKLQNEFANYYGKEWAKNRVGFEMGGSLPGATGSMYARVGAPSKGPHRNQVDVTDASAENGMEMKFYQEGLDWNPKTISANGSMISGEGEEDDIDKRIIKFNQTDEGKRQANISNKVHNLSQLGPRSKQDVADLGQSAIDFGLKTGDFLANVALNTMFPPALMEKPEWLRKETFKTWRPVSYPDDYTAIRDFRHNPNPERDDQGNLDIAEEAWSKALRLGEKPNYIVPSTQRPANATDPNAQYYTLRPGIIDQQKIIDYVRSPEYQKYKRLSKDKKTYVMEHPAMNNFISDDYQKYRKANKLTDYDQVDPIQGFQIYNGWDPVKKKNFAAIYDKYDFSSDTANSMIKPYEFYDKYYYQDGGQLTKLDQLTNFTNYNTKQPGGWLDKYQD